MPRHVINKVTWLEWLSQTLKVEWWLNEFHNWDSGSESTYRAMDCELLSFVKRVCVCLFWTRRQKNVVFGQISDLCCENENQSNIRLDQVQLLRKRRRRFWIWRVGAKLRIARNWEMPKELPAKTHFKLICQCENSSETC